MRCHQLSQGRRAPRRSAARWSCRSSATFRSQPVASCACSAVTPGWTWVSTSSRRLGVGLEDAEVGDHAGRALAAQAELLAVARAGPVADRGDEVDLLDERAGALAHDHDHLPAGRGDLRRPAGAGQAHLRVVVVAADHGRVDVGVAVDLGGAEEADVDPAGLDPVVEHLGHADDRVGGLAEHAVADRERQPRRLGADRARLVDQHEVRRVRAAGEVRAGARQADADEARVDVASARARRRRSSSRRLRSSSELLQPGGELCRGPC